jgi:hypothetical protein
LTKSASPGRERDPDWFWREIALYLEFVAIARASV